MISPGCNIGYSFPLIKLNTQHSKLITDSSPPHSPSAHDQRVGFDLHQHLGVDQAANLYHCRGGADLAEELAMRPAYSLPVLYVRDEHARAYHVLQPRPRALQGGLYVL